jgi:hypothetical protein
MTWRIELKDTESAMPIITILQARAIWKRLSKPAQEAIEAAYEPNHQGIVDAHVNTLASLERHGFVHSDCRLTDAGRAVARWNVKP